MTWLQFTSSVIGSVAWPITALVTVIVLRNPVGRLLQGPMRRLKAGPGGLELEWEREAQEVRRDIAVATKAEPPQAERPSEAEQPALSEDLHRLVEVSPSAAVLESYSQIERQLRAMLMAAGIPVTRPVGASGLASLARHHGLINAETRYAIEGLAVLRNLAAHGQADVDPAKASDFTALADATLTAIRRGSTFTDAPGFVGLLGEQRQALGERQPCRFSWTIGPGSWAVQLLTSHAFDLQAFSEPVWYIGIYADKGPDPELMFTLPVIRRPVRGAQLLVGEPTSPGLR